MKTLAAGTRAPDFHLPDQDGTVQHLSELLQRGPAVLFFFPTAGGGPCTRELMHFRDLVMRFAELGAHRVGISVDDVATLGDFAENTLLDFPVLADVDGAVAEAYGVRRRFLSPVRRTTFVVDQRQRIVEVVHSETNLTLHADRSLRVLARLA